MPRPIRRIRKLNSNSYGSCTQPEAQRWRGRSFLPASTAEETSFPIRWHLADFDFAQENFTDSFKLLETLGE